MSRKLLVVITATFGSLLLVPSANAFTTLPLWQCRASPSYTAVNDGNRVEPFAANGNINTAQGGNPDHAQCAPAETGAGNTATQIGIPQDLLGARTAGGVTTITPEIGKAIDQSVKSEAKVENVTLQLPQGGTVTLGVNAASSSVTGTCESGSTTPKLTGTSQVAGLTLGGAPLDLDPLIRAIDQLLQPLNVVVDIIPNEEIRTPTSLTRRALHVKVLTASGGTSLVDAVLAESKVAANGPVCDPASQNDGSGNGRRRRPALPDRRRAQRDRHAVRHPGRHGRLEPRRDRRRAAVPGPERRHRAPAGRRAQEVRRKPVPER